MSEPIAYRTTRFLCPHCHRSRASCRAARVHIARCWRNPDNRSCKTCLFFLEADGNSDESCGKGIAIGEARKQAFQAALSDWLSEPTPGEDTLSPFPLNCEAWAGGDTSP